MSTACCRGPSDIEWSTVQPLLPRRPRGVRRADDCEVLARISWRLRTGSPWADIAGARGSGDDLRRRFLALCRRRVRDPAVAAISAAHGGSLPIIDASCVRVDRHRGIVRRGVRTPNETRAASLLVLTRLAATQFWLRTGEPVT